MEMLKELRGHLMDMPFDFLCEENLGPSASDVAIKLVDSSVFT